MSTTHTLTARRGLPGLMFAKFVPGLDGLMPPLAGALNVTTVLFLIFDGVGALLWSAGYCFVGYLFAFNTAVNGMNAGF